MRCSAAGARNLHQEENIFMAYKVKGAPFTGSKEQEAKLRGMIEEEMGTPGYLMPIMQKAQDIYGYLPIEVQEIIAEETGVPLETIFGIATFYAQFSLNKKGKHEVSVCLGTACYVKGSDKVLAKVEETLGVKQGECTEDGVFSVTSCRCVGACGLAPVMIIDEKVYGKMTPDQVPGILQGYIDEERGN